MDIEPVRTHWMHPECEVRKRFRGHQIVPLHLNRIESNEIDGDERDRATRGWCETNRWYYHRDLAIGLSTDADNRLGCFLEGHTPTMDMTSWNCQEVVQGRSSWFFFNRSRRSKVGWNRDTQDKMISFHWSKKQIHQKRIEAIALVVDIERQMVWEMAFESLTGIDR